MKQFLPAVVSAVVLAAALLAAPALALADHTCNTASWNWPFCHIAKPSIPKVNYGAPRPPLTPKDSAWCTAQIVQAYWVDGRKANGWGWYLIRRDKVAIRFWPDYYRLAFVLVYYDSQRRSWFQPGDTRNQRVSTVNCDA
jgi:hypothetical protein